MKITTPKNKHVNLSYLSPSSATPGDSFYRCGLIGEKNKIEIMRKKIQNKLHKDLPVPDDFTVDISINATSFSMDRGYACVFGVPLDQVQDRVQDASDFRQGLGGGLLRVPHN